jgi:hypothetical protein
MEAPNRLAATARIADGLGHYWIGRVADQCVYVAKTRNKLRFGAQRNGTADRSPTRNRPLAAFSFVLAHTPVSTKVGCSIHKVRPASVFLLVAQSKATRARTLLLRGLIPLRRSRLGNNDK